jgi:hypothetical protein
LRRRPGKIVDCIAIDESGIMENVLNLKMNFRGWDSVSTALCKIDVGLLQLQFG